MTRVVGPVIGLILAGGRSRRMGVDKAFALLHGRPLIAHAVERARPQVDELLINANDAATFAAFGCPVIADTIGGFAGPLAGLHAGLNWMSGNGEAEWVATFACDTPFFPRDIVRRLVEGAKANHAPVALAASGAQHHPVFAVWRHDLRDDVRAALNEGVRKMDDFIARHAHVRMPFAFEGIDPFFNVNTPEDLQRAEGFHD